MSFRSSRLSVFTLCVGLATTVFSTAQDDCTYNVDPGDYSSLITILVYGDPFAPKLSDVVIQPAELPTLEIDQFGVGNYSVEFSGDTGSCTGTPVPSSGYTGLFELASGCPTGEQSYNWGVYNPTTGGFLEMIAPIGDYPDDLGYLQYDYLVGRLEGTTQYYELFPASGDYEIWRSFEGCTDFLPELQVHLTIPIHVERPCTGLVPGKIRFSDSFDDGTASVDLEASVGDVGCYDATLIEIHDATRYLATSAHAPDLVPYQPWNEEFHGVVSMQWEVATVGAFLEIDRDAARKATLPAEEMVPYLFKGLPARFRRKDIGAGLDGTSYTNELEVILVPDLPPQIRPIAQDICTDGALRDLFYTLDASPVGDLLHQWQSRLADGDEFVDITGATGSTLTPGLQDGEYRLELFQDFGFVNVAPLGTATQSSDWPEAPASLAIDRNVDGNFSNGSVSHTGAGDPAPTWTLELDQTYTISNVLIWNRSDCCQERFDRVRLSILDEEGEVAFEWLYDTSSLSSDQLRTLPLFFSDVKGRTIRLEHEGFAGDGENVLQLAEVQVYAREIAGPYTSDSAVVDVSESAVEYYPDGDGDGYPDKSGEPQFLCEVQEGWVPASIQEDCNDANASFYPGKRWYLDADLDGYISRGLEFVRACERPGPEYRSFNAEIPLDCDDGDAAVGEGFLWAEDKDGDGYGTGVTVTACRPPSGYRAPDEIIGPGDCDDADPKEHPGQRWYSDGDQDRVGGGPSVLGCERPEGYFLATELRGTTDCDDGDSQYAYLRRWYRDNDADGYAAANPAGDDVAFVEACKPVGAFEFKEADLKSLDIDCDDTNPELHPGQIWYPDGDGDGLGDAFGTPVEACEPPGANFVPNHRDCDDTDANPALCEAGPDAGSALSLRLADETAGRISTLAPRLGAFGQAEFFVEAWIRTSAAHQQMIISRGSTCSGTNAWSLGLAADGLLVARLVDVHDNRVDLQGTTALNDGEWHQVVLRRQGQDFSIWADVLREAGTRSASFGIGGFAPVIIGNGPEGEVCGRGFVGQIDNVRIWTEAEAVRVAGRELHRLGPGDEEGLLAHWSFDQVTLGGQGENREFAVDSAQGFPLAFDVGVLVRSTAPVGEGSVQASGLVTEASEPELVQGAVGVRILEPSLDGPSMLVLTTRLDVRPAGAAPPEGAPVAAGYWILDLVGTSTELSGDLMLEFPTDAISPDLAARPGDVALYVRAFNSDGEWSFVAAASLISAGNDTVRFDGVVLTRGQYVVTDTGVAVDPTFMRGDCNDDGTVDISDPVFNLEVQFLGEHDPGCLAALDTNGDGGMDISDPIYNLEHQFLGKPAPPPPFPGCGPESLPAEVALPCETQPASCP